MRKGRFAIPAAIALCVIAVTVFLSNCADEKNAHAGQTPEATMRDTYTVVRSDSVPFLFDMSEQAHFLIRTNDSITFFCDVIYPATTAHLYCTFRHTTEEKIPQLVSEAGKLAYNHTVVAASVTEIPLRNSYGAEGTLYKIGGDAATPYQLFLTDNVSFFFNASLYFDNGVHATDAPNEVEAMRRDMEKMIYSFRLRR